MLWPDLNKDLNMLLWANELVFALDILRKFMVKPKKSLTTDTYEIAVAYLKSSFIFDVISSLPQVASGLDEKFLPFKIFRIFNYIWALHYPFEAFVQFYYSGKGARHNFVVIYACQTLCRITILLHYLAILWVWVGSEHFSDFETGMLPWQLANTDF